MTTRVLIDDARARPGQAFLYEEPHRIIRADCADDVPQALEAIQLALDQGAHIAGFLSYELGYCVEARLASLMPQSTKVPLIFMGVFSEPKRLHDREVQALAGERDTGAYTISAPELTMSTDEYEARFQAVKDFISAGDIYQLNLTLKGRFRFSGDPFALYHDLRRKQPVSYGAVIKTDEVTVISASPELFLDIDGRRVLTRPMKGTAPREQTLERDRDVARWLSVDEKSRAENLMIVDLMRNDLGRVVKTGSVSVRDMFTVETYETLHQMTSDVEAELRPGTGVAELLASVFPPGSVTGAPKVRAMEIIRELESEPRGVYTGAIGALSPDGKARLNVAIRTLTLFRDGQGEVGIGSGIVHDSQASAEYEECLLKMKFLTDPVREFQLIETMLFEPDRDSYVLLDRHLARLQASAEYFLFPFPQQDILRSLRSRADTLKEAPYRVRLLLFRDGHFEISETKLDRGSPASMTFVVSNQTVQTNNPFLFHKTTERDLYDDEWAEMHQRYGVDEVIFLNERGELAEGSRTNIFALVDGQLVTPPLTCGLLPGTLRQDLLERDDVTESVLTLQDLARAEAVYLGNSVRGLVPAREVIRQEARSAVS